jgi:hypothetical protein
MVNQLLSNLGYAEAVDQGTIELRNQPDGKVLRYRNRAISTYLINKVGFKVTGSYGCGDIDPALARR